MIPVSKARRVEDHITHALHCRQSGITQWKCNCFRVRAGTSQITKCSSYKLSLWLIPERWVLSRYWPLALVLWVCGSWPGTGYSLNKSLSCEMTCLCDWHLSVLSSDRTRKPGYLFDPNYISFSSSVSGWALAAMWGREHPLGTIYHWQQPETSHLGCSLTGSSGRYYCTPKNNLKQLKIFWDKLNLPGRKVVFWQEN